MKLPINLGPYCAAAFVTATIVREKVTPAIEIMDPVIMDKMVRVLSILFGARTPPVSKIFGSKDRSIATVTNAKITDPNAMTAGMK